MAACARQIQRAWDRLEASLRPAQEPAEAVGDPGRGASQKKPGPHAPALERLAGWLIRLCGGKDLTARPACPTSSLLPLIGEVGWDLSQGPTEKPFPAGLGRAPGTPQRGQSRRGVGRKRHRAGRGLGGIVRSLARPQDTAVGGFSPRRAARRGGLLAIVAPARTLAGLSWQAMVKGLASVEEGLKRYETRVRETKQQTLQRLARHLGVTLLPSLSAPTSAQ